tara:strand:+ start:215 stop:535 length:321 start_codon:yes stop_codon:yes gene_type:complete
MKSRQTLAIIEENGVIPDVVLYLEKPPTKTALKEILKMLGLKPEELLRRGEAIYKDNYKGKELTNEEWIDAMIEHPKLIERPIVVSGDKAVIGRPPENVLDLISKS